LHPQVAPQRFDLQVSFVGFFATGVAVVRVVLRVVLSYSRKDVAAIMADAALAEPLND
jgi:hypothetical protein